MTVTINQVKCADVEKGEKRDRRRSSRLAR